MSDAQASETTITDSAASTTAAPEASTATTAAPATEASTAAVEPGSLLTDESETPAEKPADTDTPKEGEGESKEEKAEEKGAPDEYTEFELPENVNMDSPVMDEFKAVAKETGLSQEAAQKMVTLAAKMQTNVVDKLRSHVDTTAKEWAATAKADPEFGGAQFDASLGLAKKALDTFGTPELKTLLKESRMGSNPEVIRFMVRAGKAISQDGFVSGRASASTPKADHEVFYGNTTPTK